MLNFDCSPIDYAKSLPKKELRALIRECKRSVTEEYDEWTDRCRICFEKYAKGEMELAGWWSHHAELVRPR